jgi:hypothetical protein
MNALYFLQGPISRGEGSFVEAAAAASGLRRIREQGPRVGGQAQEHLTRVGQAHQVRPFDDAQYFDQTAVFKRGLGRVARFFSVILTKLVENIPTNQQIYQMALNYTKWP